MSGETFDEAWVVADAVGGWLTREQALMLWDAAGRLGPGDIAVEIGSHQGRSTVVLGTAARRTGARVVAIDPFVEGRLFGGPRTRDLFEATIAAAGLAGDVDLHVARSTELRPNWSAPIGVLYVDGKHDYWTCSDDMRWGEHLPADGELLLHDCFYSVGVTLAVIVHVLLGHEWTYVSRERSMALFRRRRPDLRNRLLVAAQLRVWIPVLVIKVFQRLRLLPLARLMGHDADHDPF